MPLDLTLGVTGIQSIPLIRVLCITCLRFVVNSVTIGIPVRPLMTLVHTVTPMKKFSQVVVAVQSILVLLGIVEAILRMMTILSFSVRKECRDRHIPWASSMVCFVLFIYSQAERALTLISASALVSVLQTMRNIPMTVRLLPIRPQSQSPV